MNPRLPGNTVLALMMLVSCGISADNGPEFTEDGLQRVDGTRAAVVYADPEADFSVYNRIMLDPATVAFRKNWLRDQRSGSANPLSVTSSDMEKIKRNLAELFNEEFSKALAEGGYEVTTESGEDVLRVSPAIINLDVNAPDTGRTMRSRSYTESAGEMTLFVELYDSVTGDLLAKAQDRREDRNSGFYTWTSSVTNRAAATRIIKGWAGILVEALDEAHGSAAKQ